MLRLVWPAVRIVTVTALAALLLVALPGTGRGDHETYPPSWYNNPEGQAISTAPLITGNHICQLDEKVKVRLFVKATQNPPMLLAQHAYNTTLTYGTANGDVEKHDVTYYYPEPAWEMGQGWWLVNSVTLPEGKIGKRAHSHGVFDHLPPPQWSGTIWLYHQKRCV